MKRDLIDGLAPAERFALFVFLGLNGLFWVGVMYGVVWLFSFDVGFKWYVVCWAVVVLYTLWLLKKLHANRIDDDMEG